MKQILIPGKIILSCCIILLSSCNLNKEIWKYEQKDLRHNSILLHDRYLVCGIGNKDENSIIILEKSTGKKLTSFNHVLKDFYIVNNTLYFFENSDSLLKLVSFDFNTLKVDDRQVLFSSENNNYKTFLFENILLIGNIVEKRKYETINSEYKTYKTIGFDLKKKEKIWESYFFNTFRSHYFFDDKKGLVYLDTRTEIVSLDIHTGKIFLLAAVEDISDIQLKRYKELNSKLFESNTDFNESPVQTNNRLVFISSNIKEYSVKAVNLETLENEWQYESGKEVINTPLYEYNGTVFFVESNKTLTALDSESGMVKWTYSFKKDEYIGNIIQLFFEDKRIYIAAFSVIYCWDVDTGKLLKKVSLNNDFMPPIVYEDGIMYYYSAYSYYAEEVNLE